MFLLVTSTHSIRIFLISYTASSPAIGFIYSTVPHIRNLTQNIFLSYPKSSLTTTSFLSRIFPLLSSLDHRRSLPILIIYLIKHKNRIQKGFIRSHLPELKAEVNKLQNQVQTVIRDHKNIIAILDPAGRRSLEVSKITNQVCFALLSRYQYYPSSQTSLQILSQIQFL